MTSNSNIDEILEMLDVNKISSAHDLYSGKPAPYSEGYRNGFNTAKSMLKQAIQQELLKARLAENQLYSDWFYSETDNIHIEDFIANRIANLQAKLKGEE